MSKAEDLYLDAIEASDAGERERAKELAQQAVELDPEHADALWMIAGLSLPVKKHPDMNTAAKTFALCRKVTRLDPRNAQAWILGGRLLTDELGMYEDALVWWQDFREHHPGEAVAVIEQTAILTDMGLYEEALGRLESLVIEDLDIGATQMARVARLHQLVSKAAMQERKELFRPWEKGNRGWDAIRMKMTRGPVSEALIFLAITMPFLLLEVYISRPINEAGGWGAFCLTSLVILLTVGYGMRLSRRIFQRVNRPAFNLLRAMDLETSSGYKMIPEDIRTSKLFMYLLSRRSHSFQERLLKIVESEKELPKNWKPSIPDLDSHLDEIGFIEEGIEEEIDELPGYEEE